MSSQSACRTKSPSNKTFPPLPAQNTPIQSLSQKRRICIAGYDLFGPARSEESGTALTSLAQALASAGHEVTLLYLSGSFCDNRTMDFWIADYRQKGITFTPLPEPKLKMLGNWHTSRAYATYLWLKEQNFDIIHFPEWKGAGYYCLLSKHQGLAFQNTVLCVHAHGPSWWHKSANSEYIDNVEDLEVNFLERESVRLADVLVSPSQYLLNWMLDQKWTLPEKTFVRHYVMPRNVDGGYMRDASTLHRVEEIVFFGRLEHRKGLMLFCEAMDKMKQKDLRFKITFLGEAVTIAGQSSEFYIKERSRDWPWPVQILTSLDRYRAMDYLKGNGRLAVMPSIADNMPNTVLECLGAGIPFITSQAGGMREMIAEADVESTCVPLRSAALAYRLEQLLDAGIRPARIAVDIEANEKAWVSWHSLRECAQEEHAVASGISPLISICIAHRNRPSMLHRALQSVHAQDYTNFEVIVVDDGSDSPEALAYLKGLEGDFAARGWSLLRQENRYPGAARNLAVRQARGDYILFMDDDNCAKPHELSTFLTVAQRTGASILTCLLDIFTGDPPESGDANARQLFLGPAASLGVFENGFGDTNSLVKRDVFKKIGGFHEVFGVNHEDRELFARAILNGFHLEVIPEALVWYRHSDSGLNHSTPTHANNMRGIQPYIEAVPDCLQDLVMMAQGMRYAQDRMASIAVTLSQEVKVKPFIIAGRMVAELGQREAAMNILTKLMQELKTITAPDVIVGAFLGAAEFLIALKDWERATLFLMNARKIAAETGNDAALQKADTLLKSHELLERFSKGCLKTG